MIALPPGNYQTVSLVDVMHHIGREHQKHVLQAAFTRVTPGGLLIYKDMVNKPAWKAFANRLHDLLFARQWIHYVPARRIIEWAESSGGVLLQQATINRWWYGDELLVFRRREHFNVSG